MRGLLTKQQLRGRCWRRLFHDVYVHAELPDSIGLRARAAALLAPAGAVLSGTTAAAGHGADILRGEAVEVTLPPGSRIRPRPGLAVRQARLAEADIMPIGDVLVTTPLRTAFDLACRPASRGDLTEHVVAADALAHRGLLTAQQLVAFAARPRFVGLRGVRQVAEVAAHIEPRTESPGETRLRMRVVRAGLPRPTAQVEVHDACGRFVARVDLAYEKPRIAVEYDGEWHSGRWAADIARSNQLREAGWEHLRYTRHDLRPGRDTIPRQLREALRRRGGAERLSP